MSHLDPLLTLAIEEVVADITDEFTTSTVAFEKDVVEKLKASKYDFDDPDVFETLFRFNLEQVACNIGQRLLETTTTSINDKWKTRFIFGHYGFLSSHIKMFVLEYNLGKPVGSYDFANHIINKYLQFAITGEIDDADKIAEIGYGTNEQWVRFCDSLHELYTGCNENYLVIYKELVNDFEERGGRGDKHVPFVKYKLIAKFEDNGEIIVKVSDCFDDMTLPRFDGSCYSIPKDSFILGKTYKDATNMGMLNEKYYAVPKGDIRQFTIVQEFCS